MLETRALEAPALRQLRSEILPVPSAVSIRAPLRCLIHPFSDFWLLGGASILVWLALFVGGQFRADSSAVDQRFFQLGLTFAFLSLVCNHPHFLISYRFGYGRGWKFILGNWFALLLVPALMMAAFACGFVYFDSDYSNGPVPSALNGFFAKTNLKFRVAGSGLLGPEILGLSVWLMYLTVGWHYAKQVYGSMLVYAHLDGYQLTSLQKRIIKWNVFSVSILQFVSATSMSDLYSRSELSDPRFPGLILSPLGLPHSVLVLSEVALAVLSLAFLGVLFSNYLRNKRWPSANFLIPWLAFLVWWAPLIIIPEFFLMIPFFHSLQYLPFAYKLEASSVKSNRYLYVNVSLKIIVLLIAGFLAFEFIPGKLDEHFRTDIYQLPWFFATCFSVFINIHHFFIDSVVWKFQQPEVRAALLDP